MGDCIQLCFAEELANCSWGKLNNDKCDEGCDNNYCSGYRWGSDFSVAKSTWYGHSLYSADFEHCPLNGSEFVTDTNTNLTCFQSSSNSMFIDHNLPNHSSLHCQDHWIKDGMCSYFIISKSAM